MCIPNQPAANSGPLNTFSEIKMLGCNQPPDVSMETPSRTTTGRRPTAAERKLERQEQRKREEQAFEESREHHWLALWAQALRLQLLVAAKPACREAYSSWFRDFKVDPTGQTLMTENIAPAQVSASTLSLADYEAVLGDLTEGQRAYDRFVEGEQQERLRREELAARKNAALAKLTTEEIKLLGLPSSFHA